MLAGKQGLGGKCCRPWAGQPVFIASASETSAAREGLGPPSSESCLWPSFCCSYHLVPPPRALEKPHGPGTLAARPGQQLATAREGFPGYCGGIVSSKVSRRREPWPPLWPCVLGRRASEGSVGMPVLVFPPSRHFLRRPCGGPGNSDTARPHTLGFVVNVLVWQERCSVRRSLRFFWAPGPRELVRELLLVPAGDSCVPLPPLVSAGPEEEEVRAFLSDVGAPPALCLPVFVFLSVQDPSWLGHTRPR